nr:hypothetical protein [Deltaproteobacteria bacterium]
MLAALALLVATATAEAEPVKDLRVRQLPVRLKMPPRPKLVAQTADPPATPAAADDAATNAPTIDPYAESSLGTFKRFPTTRKELAERVTFKLRAGVELEGAGSSGEPLKGGASLPSGYAASRPWIVGDAMVGARDLVMPSLGAYFLASFQLDASDSLATRTAFARPYDSDEANSIAIKAGYAEWGRDDRQPNQKLWLRGGRQFRLDGGALFAYFDGATLGYRERAWEVSAFAGQRVTLYVDTPRGMLFGATAALDLKKSRDLPFRIAADYLGLAVDGLGVMEETASQTRQLLALTGHY